MDRPSSPNTARPPSFPRRWPPRGRARQSRHRGAWMTEHRSDPIESPSSSPDALHRRGETGAALRRTAISPNIKERRDYSALFDAEERVIAMAITCRCILAPCPCRSRRPPTPSDAARRHAHPQRSFPRRHAPAGYHSGAAGLCARPFASRLLCRRARACPRGRHVRRLHGPGRRKIYQEGLRIPPVLLMQRGEMVPGILASSTARMPGTISPRCMSSTGGMRRPS